MDSTTTTALDLVVMAQQIQALIANEQELMKQNEDLKRKAHLEGTSASQSRGNHDDNDDKAHNPNSRRETSKHTAQSTRGSNQMMKNMRKELDEVKNVFKGKTAINLDGMIKRTDLPFTTSVLECPLPPKFHLSQLEVYDGTKDPLDHIRAFKAILNLQQTPYKVICRTFLAILRRAAKVWFSKLPATSIANFNQLSDSFVCHFIRGQCHKRLTSYLLTIKQQEGETLREYVKRFNKAVLEIDEANDQVIMTTFQVGLNNPDLLFSLGKTPPASMTNLLFKVQKYMNGEDALTAKELTGKQKKEESAESQCKKRDHKDNLIEAKASKSDLEMSSKKKLNFTPLLMPMDKILMQIKDDPVLKWPKPLISSSKRKDKKKYYRFHKDHGHYIDECQDLKEQIEELIQRGKLQNFVKKDYQAR
ncbi:uncharacterized protein LOC142632553 [Castanea sativa]|uniref:uncharacterized protein LOC142632553 n=1 Tax=Castanea sativa TaxID=21020 RepID=UPI003F65437B